MLTKSDLQTSIDFARMPAGFCGLDPIRAGSCKEIGGQLTKVSNEKRKLANKSGESLGEIKLFARLR